ncbi:MAG: hypothetical protein KJP19_02080 [Deltaproteobacteria bacterium]|nr:hypothetical protein [Deltaproteobacteria bacterium]
MIINSSQISMDASTGHKDVSRTSSGKILSRNHLGHKDQHFNPDFSILKNLIAEQNTARMKGSQQARSAVDSTKNKLREFNENHVISQAVSALTGAETTLREINPKPFSERILSSLQAPRRAERRFYRLGGQQFSMSFSSHKVQYEYEFANFNSSGKVTTADGRNIDFSLNVSIQRQTIVRQSIFAHAAAGYLIDPLVLHFESGLDTLSEQSFRFDMDGDGEQEILPGLRQGSGFLALDLDEDNKITIGKELFGPLSGSGFADLAVHDLDENNWIDENDPIFSKLKVWMNPSASQQQLVSLKDAGVGAISLSHAGSLFNLKSAENIVLGQVSASGIFLTENGEVKTLQDLKYALPSNKATRTGIDNRGFKDSTSQAITALRLLIAAKRSQMELLAKQHFFSSSKKEEDEDLRWNFLIPSKDDISDTKK